MITYSMHHTTPTSHHHTTLGNNTWQIKITFSKLHKFCMSNTGQLQCFSSLHQTRKYHIIDALNAFYCS